jgi:hypothetical protein
VTAAAEAVARYELVVGDKATNPAARKQAERDALAATEGAKAGRGRLAEAEVAHDARTRWEADTRVERAMAGEARSELVRRTMQTTQTQLSTLSEPELMAQVAQQERAVANGDKWVVAQRRGVARSEQHEPTGDDDDLTPSEAADRRSIEQERQRLADTEGAQVERMEALEMMRRELATRMGAIDPEDAEASPVEPPSRWPSRVGRSDGPEADSPSLESQPDQGIQP